MHNKQKSGKRKRKKPVKLRETKEKIKPFLSFCKMLAIPVKSDTIIVSD
jgi:hypothetical protein